MKTTQSIALIALSLCPVISQAGIDVWTTILRQTEEETGVEYVAVVDSEGTPPLFFGEI